jgi:hypothetical protein
MRHGIPQFRARQPLDRQLSAATLNDIRKELESLRITNVVNGSFRKLPGGTEIVVAPQRAASSTQTQPWDLVARRNPSNENQYLLSVQPGTLNGILPTNWDEEFPCASTGLFYAKVVVATDGEAITGITIEIDAAPPSSQSPVKFGVASSVDIVFGLFSEGSIYRTIGSVGNIVASPQLWLTTERQSSPQPGELPFDQYYLLV